jgi:hypothetical protein
LNLVDDTPIVPGDVHPAFPEIEASRQILTDAEDELRSYELNVEPIHSSAGNLGVGAMPGSVPAVSTSVAESTTYESTLQGDSPIVERPYDTAASGAYPVEGTTGFERQDDVPRHEVSHVA